jgi:hypothetical protein
MVPLYCWRTLYQCYLWGLQEGEPCTQARHGSPRARAVPRVNLSLSNSVYAKGGEGDQDSLSTTLADLAVFCRALSTCCRAPTCAPCSTKLAIAIGNHQSHSAPLKVACTQSFGSDEVQPKCPLAMCAYASRCACDAVFVCVCVCVRARECVHAGRLAYSEVETPSVWRARANPGSDTQQAPAAR